MKPQKQCISDGLQYLSNPPQLKCKTCGQFWFIKDEAPICKTVELNSLLGEHFEDQNTERWEEDLKIIIDAATRLKMVEPIMQQVRNIRSQAAREERERVMRELSLMREPTPSANSHKEYNRGIREGVELIRNAVLSLREQHKQ